MAALYVLAGLGVLAGSVWCVSFSCQRGLGPGSGGSGRSERPRGLIEVEDAAEALSALDTAGGGSARLGQGDDVADALVVPLVMVVLDVLGEEMVQVALAERDHVAKAFLTDGISRTVPRTR